MKRWTIGLAILLAVNGTLLSAQDLFDENARLKAELDEQRRQLQPLHEKNQELEIKIEALTVTNNLITGKLKTPPRDAPASQLPVWDYKLDSGRDCLGADWPPCATAVKDGETTVLKITGVEGDKAKPLVQKWFSKEELAKVKGKTITCTVLCKGDNIADNGKACFMLMAPTSSQKTGWPDAQIGKGSFDWRTVQFSYSVPLDATGIMMILGLQGTTGSVYYKDLKVTVSEPAEGKNQ